MKTIDVLGKKWFDKVNGNTYFSARIIIDFQMEGEKIYYIPYEYGYGDQYLYTAFDYLASIPLLPEEAALYPTEWTRENGIILRYGIQAENKRNVIAWGKP